MPRAVTLRVAGALSGTSIVALVANVCNCNEMAIRFIDPEGQDPVDDYDAFSLC